MRQNDECGLSRCSLGGGGSVLDIRDRGMRKLWRKRTYFTDSDEKGPSTRWEEREEGKGGYLAEGPKLYKMK